MTKQEAIKACKKSAKKAWHTMYVVYDVSYAEKYGKNDAYALASLYDLDTFYLGEKPIYAAEPD